MSRAPVMGLALLWLLACGLALIGLGALPLRDFDEGIVARVALELSQKQGSERLLPTLWGSPYLNKPPGLHGIIAFAIQISGNGSSALSQPPSAFVVRIMPALVSTLVVPLAGLVQWHLRTNDRLASLATAGILLTLMPVARHGRLAMLDGPQLSAMAMLWLLLLAINRGPMDRWKAFGAGLSSSAMLLLKAPLLIPAAAAALVPILWGGELKQSWRWPLAGWLALGLIPGLAWHVMHGLERGIGALWLWGGDGAGRVLFSAGEGSDLGWKVPVIEMLEGGWPWLVLWPFALVWAWQQRHNRWGRWALSTQAVLAMSILPLKTQLPWYSHPLWLPVALLCGVPLAWLIRREKPNALAGTKLLSRVPSFWLTLGIALLALGLLGASGLVLELRPYSSIAICAGAGWGVGGLLLVQQTTSQRLTGAISLMAGSFAALALMMGGSFWLWELNENWPVQPVAQLANRAKGSELVLEGNDERPSLNWYASQRIQALESLPNASWILSRHPKKVQAIYPSRSCHTTDKEGEWSLVFCDPISQ